jgi:hypothetical protein
MNSITELAPGAYFALYYSNGSLKGYYQLDSIHVTGKTVSYHDVNWLEWLWCDGVLQTLRSFPRFKYNIEKRDTL